MMARYLLFLKKIGVMSLIMAEAERNVSIVMEKIQCNNCIRKNKLICYDKGGNPI